MAGLPGSAEEPSGLWADAAIKEATEDRFGRVEFARHVADVILSVPHGSDSTVLAVVGPWGSGKTSILNLVASSVREAGNVHVSTYSPWATSSGTDLLRSFLTTLVATFSPSSSSYDRTRSAIRRYAGMLTPGLATIPVVGAGIAGVADRVVAEATAERTWDQVFEQTALTLRGDPRRILVVIDDLDRLDGDELMTLLKAVRLLGRLPNVHYLLAFDRETVRDHLGGAAASGVGSRFLEKIVQHTFDMPSMQRVHVRSKLGQTIDVLVSAHQRQNPEFEASDSRRLLLIDALEPAVATPRSLLRLEVAASRLARLGVVRDIDPYDLAALTFLRHHAASVVPWMVRKSEQLRGGHARWLTTPDNEVSEAEWRDELRRVFDDSGLEESVIATLSLLFKGLGIAGYPYVDHELAFSDPNIQERYLVLGVPIDDVSDALVQSALSHLTGVRSDTGDGAVEALRALLVDEDESRASAAMSKVRRTRMRTTVGNLQILEFLLGIEQPTRYGSEAGELSREWVYAVSREFAQLVLQADIDVEWAFTRLGLARTLQFVSLARRETHIDRNDGVRALRPFAEQYLGRLRDRPAELVDGGVRLGYLVSFLVSVLGAEPMKGLASLPLVRAVGAERFAMQFVAVQRWVSSTEVELELNFEDETARLVLAVDAALWLLEALPEPEVDQKSQLDPELEGDRQIYANDRMRRVAAATIAPIVA